MKIIKVFFLSTVQKTTQLTLILQATRKSVDLPSENEQYFELAQMCHFILLVTE